MKQTIKQTTQLCKLFQVASYRSHENLFLALTPPHKPVGSKSLARWLSHLLGLARINTTIFAPHSSKAASAAHHKNENDLSVSQILKLADWSQTSGVYKMFYERFVI